MTVVKLDVYFVEQLLDLTVLLLPVNMAVIIILFDQITVLLLQMMMEVKVIWWTSRERLWTGLWSSEGGKGWALMQGMLQLRILLTMNPYLNQPTQRSNGKSWEAKRNWSTIFELIALNVLGLPVLHLQLTFWSLLWDELKRKENDEKCNDEFCCSYASLNMFPKYDL